MNSNPHDPTASGSASSPAEETLRLIASLPAPKGLEERVQTVLDSAPRRGRVLTWPGTLRPQSGWMRSAAAAAIVFVVAGGGWGVYTKVEQVRFDQNGPAKVIVMPARMPGGFGGAGAIRTPQTLPGPKAPVRLNRQTRPALPGQRRNRLRSASRRAERASQTRLLQSLARPARRVPPAATYP